MLNQNNTVEKERKQRKRKAGQKITKAVIRTEAKMENIENRRKPAGETEKWNNKKDKKRKKNT